MKTLITIITVCRNAEAAIEKTIQSVIKQNYPQIEYIIIDGRSTDRTLEIIGSYKDKYPIKVISEPDHGIYDAMNKGLSYATGDYIQFLNAGDTLLEETTIEQVVNLIQEKKADIFYGNIFYEYASGIREERSYGPACAWKIYYATGDCINHQAIFASKRCFEEGFDLSYQICADRDWMMRMHRKGYRYQCLNIPICVYLLNENSASVRMGKKLKEETERCIKENFPGEYILYAFFEFLRNNAVLSKMLHGIYRLIYIKNGEQDSK